MSFVTSISESEFERLRLALEEKDFSFSQPPHTVFCAKNPGISCTLYSSGKLVVQGKNTQEFKEFFLEPEILGTFSINEPSSKSDMNPRIGVDESGKGDFFGPLCIAGVLADNEKMLSELYKSGIKDSKKLTDSSILDYARIVKECCVYEIVKIEPEKYNLLYDKFRNLNRMLAWGHATVLEKLASRTSNGNIFAISDQFANEKILIEALKNKAIDFPVIQRVRAEADVVVAAASVLARESFILSIKKLEKIHNFPLPKGGGATAKSQGLRIAKEHGVDVLETVCKRHFKTYGEIIDIVTNRE